MYLSFCNLCLCITSFLIQKLLVLQMDSARNKLLRLQIEMRIFDRFIFLKWPCNSAWGLFSRVFLQSPFLFQGCSLSWVSCMLTSEMNNVVLVCANHWSHSVGSFNIHYSSFPLFEFPSFVPHISKTLRREKKEKQCFHLSCH